MLDVVVIGGGMVGAAIAYGCVRRGATVAMIDGGDGAFRAARANAGLVFSQCKGVGMPAYAAWTRECIDLWPDFAEEMSSAAGRDIGFRQTGGMTFCVGAEEMEARRRAIGQAEQQPGGASTPIMMVDRKELQDLMPRAPFAPEVCGGSYTPRDAQLNPLFLLRGLHAGFRARGGHHYPGRTVSTITPRGEGYRVTTDTEALDGRRVVIAAGIATQALAASVGMHVPVVPTRGQAIITERIEPILPMGCSGVRQTMEGTLQIGVTFEPDVSDRSTDVNDLSRMTSRAIEVFPAIRHLRMVRAWAGIRPVPPDGFPEYAWSATHPGISAAVCHSGVTLASGHAGPIAEAVLSGVVPERLADLGVERFGV